jgi:hypothetical protein
MKITRMLHVVLSAHGSVHEPKLNDMGEIVEPS